MSLNELAAEVHAMAVEHGFWDHGEQRNFAEVCMLIVSEAVEAMEEHRVGMPLTRNMYQAKDGENRSRYQSAGTPKPVGVPSEMADIIIRTLDACGAFDIDIEAAIREKIEYNRTRAHKHGKQF